MNAWMLSLFVLHKIFEISYMSYVCQAIPQKTVLGEETDREPTFGIKYPAWNSSHETLGDKQPLKISAVI